MMVTVSTETPLFILCTYTNPFNCTMFMYNRLIILMIIILFTVAFIVECMVRQTFYQYTEYDHQKDLNE